MKRLILLRHCSYNGHHLPPGDQEHNPHLDRSGRVHAVALGKAFNAHGLAPDAILITDTNRTQQTLTGVLGQITRRRVPTKTVREIDWISDAHAGQSLELIRNVDAQDASTLLAVTHRPIITDSMERLPTPATIYKDTLSKTYSKFGVAFVLACPIGRWSELAEQDNAWVQTFMPDGNLGIQLLNHGGYAPPVPGQDPAP